MEQFPCVRCGSPALRRRPDSMYCSKSCAMKVRRPSYKMVGRKGPRPERKTGTIINCLCCQKEIYIPKHRIGKTKYCSQSCLAKVHLKQFASPWKKLNLPKRKYKVLTVNGKQVREHRHIMSQFLGRKLKRWEHVHHINGDPQDNRIENLVLLTSQEHPVVELLEKRHQGLL